MGEDRLPEQFMTLKTMGRMMKKGASKTTQMDGIRGMMREIGFTEEDWRDEKTGDRR